jgi:hypothetical protein
MTTTHLLQFLSALLVPFTLVAQNASGGPETRPSPGVNSADDINAEVKSRLDGEFKNEKFDTGSDPKTIRASLRFSAPEEIRTKVITTIGQEFKKLDDVSISISDVDYEVSIVASVISGGKNQPLYIISLVVAKSPAAVKANPKQFSAIMGHTVETGEQLEDLCKRVATETNAHVFEQERNARKLSREMVPTPSPR